MNEQGRRVLEDFIVENRDAIIERSQARVAARTAPRPTDGELADGIPVFLDQLGDALQLARSSDLVDHEEIRRTASGHGAHLLRLGLTIGQVVHDYGAVCQTITELAVEQQVPLESGEFQTLNLCFDDAIAGAVTEFASQRERSVADRGTENLGFLAHEMRNLLHMAVLSFESIKTGRVAPGGSTGMVLSRSLIGLRDLIDRSLAEVRLEAGIDRSESISVAELIDEVGAGASLEAGARGLGLHVGAVDRALMVQGDRPILAAAVANLVQNAIKFTHEHSHVSLDARLSRDRVLIAVEDHCGGLPPGKAEDLFRPFEQKGGDRTGLGLGLAICFRAAQAHGGEVRVEDLPGQGCIFTLDLPLAAVDPT